MKRIGILLVAVVGIAMLLNSGGCGKKAEATVTCSNCGMVIEKTLAKDIDGKWMCPVCAATVAAETKAEAELVECAGGCGMKMRKEQFTLVDGKYYCAGCMTRLGLSAEAETTGRDLEPPPGTEAH